MPIEFTVNRRPVVAPDEQADMPLLWFLREEQRLKGTKYGCGIGQCGACTVLSSGNAVRSCVMTLADAKGAEITTIEGLAPDDQHLHPVQEAWIAADVPQCGYCQSGQILAAVALLSRKPNPTDADIDDAMTNICRCGTYVRIRKAVKDAAARTQGRALVPQMKPIIRPAIATLNHAARDKPTLILANEGVGET